MCNLDNIAYRKDILFELENVDYTYQSLTKHFKINHNLATIPKKKGSRNSAAGISTLLYYTDTVEME